MASEILYTLDPADESFWRDSGGDLVATWAGLASGAGRVGAQWDTGSKATPGAGKAAWYQFDARFQFQADPVVQDVISLWIAEAYDDDAAAIAGNVGASDAAVLVDKLFNLKWIANIVVDVVSQTVPMRKIGDFWSAARYISPVVWNGTADQISTTVAENHVKFTPYQAEIQ